MISCHCSRFQWAAWIYTSERPCFECNFQYLCKWTGLVFFFLFKLYTWLSNYIFWSAPRPPGCSCIGLGLSANIRQSLCCKALTQQSPWGLVRSGSPPGSIWSPPFDCKESSGDTALPAGRNTAAQEESGGELLRTGISQRGKTLWGVKYDQYFTDDN